MSAQGTPGDVLHVIVRGEVQGVGFRYFTQRMAQRLGVTGWVRNLPGGEVEVLARTPQGSRERFLAALQQGPPMSRVEGIDVRPAPPGEDPPAQGFRVRR